MPEAEITNEVVEEIVETVEPEEQTTEVEEKVEPTDKRESILDYIKGAVKSVVSPKVKTEEVVEEDTSKNRLAGQDIPEKFVSAAEADGWNLKDIQAYAADKTDEELLELIPHLVPEEEDEDETEEPVKEEKPKVSVETDDEIEALKSSIRDEIREEFRQEYGSKLDVLDDFRAEQTSRQNMQVFETANELMDEASKDFSVFGKFEEIPRFTTGPREGEPVPTSPEFKARAEVFQLAADLMSTGRSASMKDAMGDALSWYRGKHGQKETERKVIRNLKQQQTKLSGSRTGKEVKKEYANTREEMIDEIRMMQKAAKS